MKKVIIYQIGRLDRDVFKEYEFEINEKPFKTSLSSFALRQYFCCEGFDPKVILLYPVSLPLNPSLRGNSGYPEDCNKNLEIALQNPKVYLKDPSHFFDHHPHTKKADHYYLIHSLGEYNTLEGTIRFDCYYHDIVLLTLLHMLDLFLKEEEGIERIIIDISSGHNIYVSALIEASRFFGTWIKLYHWNGLIPSLEIAFSDPIIPGISRFKINTEELKVQALFSSPIGYDDLNNNSLALKIYPEKNQRDKKRQLQSFLENFAIIFSAIKNNTPLAIYTFGYHDLEDIKRDFDELVSHTIDKLKQAYDSTPNLDKSAYIKVLLSFAFYMGLCRIIKSQSISKSNEINIDKLRNDLENIYGKFKLNLNDTILGNEIDKIKKALEKDKDIEWKSLSTILYPESNITPPQKRNFFAHAGFEANITECMKNGKEIYLRYITKHIDMIKGWLKESV